MQEADKKYSLLFRKPPTLNQTENDLDSTNNTNFVFHQTHLNFADVAIFYRILEAGIIYRENEDDSDYEK
tara:strand:- start:755 stop:964 length:210 start_codon:yes stop_codon:yes gene_type:complete